MGWAGGGRVMEPIIKTIKKCVPDEKIRVRMYKDIINALEDADWDTQDECIGLDTAFDAALKRLHPNWEI